MAAIVTPAEGARRLRQLNFAIEQMVLREVTLGMREARRRAVQVYMLPRAPKTQPPAADKLTIRSGALARSVKLVPVERRGDTIVAGLEAGGLNVPYANIHESGGRTGPHVIEPLKGTLLRWAGTGPAPQVCSRASGRLRSAGPKGGGFWIFARKVNHPGSDIPARPYLLPALLDGRDAILRNVQQGFETVKQQLGF